MMQLTSLGNADDVETLADGGEAEHLDRCRRVIASELHVAEHGGMKTSVLEVHHRLEAGWTLLVNGDLGNAFHMVSLADKSNEERNLHRKVDAGTTLSSVVGATEQLDLELRVLGTNVTLLTIPLIDDVVCLPVVAGAGATGVVLAIVVALSLCPASSLDSLLGRRVAVGGSAALSGVGLGGAGLSLVGDRRGRLLGLTPISHDEMMFGC